MRRGISFIWISIFMSGIIATAQIQELDWPIEIVSQGHGFTEGPTILQDGRICFSDMDNRIILSYNPTTDSTKVWQPESMQTNGLFFNDNYLYACEAAGKAVVRYNYSIGPESKEVIVNKFQEDSLGRPNDLTIIGDDLIFSDIWNGRVFKASINNRSLDSIPFDFENPNGIGRSPDGNQLYVSDYVADKLYRAEVTKGQVGPMHLILDLSTYELSGPDGMAISEEGYIFLALYGSERVIVIAPNDKIIGYLPTGPLSSNCVFAEDGRTLYITADKKLMRVKVPNLLHLVP